MAQSKPNGTSPLQNALLIPRSQIRANTQNARQLFDATELKELASTIKAHGLLHPLVVRYEPSRYDGTPYILIDGERRLRASEGILGALPCIVSEVEAGKERQLSLIANLQRTDLTPIEEAHGIADLMKSENLSALRAAKELGRSQGWINNRLALLKTGKDVQSVAARSPLAMSSLLLIDAVKDKSFRNELLSDVESGAAHSVIKNKIEAHAATERERRVFSAPDAHTQSRITAYESNGTPNMSRGKRVTGTSAKQAVQSFEWGLKEVSAGISTMENFRDKLPSRKKYLPEIRKQIARLEKLAE